MSQKTRQCTEVFYGQSVGPGLPKFEVRKYDRRLSPGVKAFDSANDIDHQGVLLILENLLEGLRPERRQMRPRGSQKKWLALLKKQKINEKRRLVLSYMNRQQNINIKDAAKFAHVSEALVRRVRQQMLLGQSVSFEYPNLKGDTEVAALRESISNLDENYHTVSDLKRSHHGFSRSWILSELKRLA